MPSSSLTAISQRLPLQRGMWDPEGPPPTHGCAPPTEYAGPTPSVASTFFLLLCSEHCRGSNAWHPPPLPGRALQAILSHILFTLIPTAMLLGSKWGPRAHRLGCREKGHPINRCFTHTVQLRNKKGITDAKRLLGE